MRSVSADYLSILKWLIPTAMEIVFQWVRVPDAARDGFIPPFLGPWILFRKSGRRNDSRDI